MGQQQLLLLVLSAVIVGLSIVAGINIFDSSNTRANKDAITQDLMTIGSIAQSWYIKPAEMGGGGKDFTNFTLADISWPDSTANGTFSLDAANATQATVKGFLQDGSYMLVTVQAHSVAVSGPLGGS